VGSSIAPQQLLIPDAMPHFLRGAAPGTL